MTKAQLIGMLSSMSTDDLATLVRLATRALQTRREIARRRQ